MKVSFYCGDCALDQDLEARKGKIRSGEEYFFVLCVNCKRRLIRMITEPKNDPYFRQSKKIRRQRAEMAKDLIQPGEAGFQILYKAEYDKIERAREEAELKEKMKKRADIALYEKHRHNINEREAVKRVFQIEEKMNGG